MVGLDHRGLNVNDIPQEEDIGCPFNLPVICQEEGHSQKCRQITRFKKIKTQLTSHEPQREYKAFLCRQGSMVGDPGWFQGITAHIMQPELEGGGGGWGKQC